MATLEEALAKFELIATKLNAESDSVNDLISEVNSRMANAGAGVTTWLKVFGEPVLLATNTDVGERHGLQLGFAKTKERWQLAVRTARLFWVRDDETGEYHSSLADIGDASPLAEAPRIVRVEACKHFSALVEEMTERVTGFVDDIARSKAEIGLTTRKKK